MFCSLWSSGCVKNSSSMYFSSYLIWPKGDNNNNNNYVISRSVCFIFAKRQIRRGFLPPFWGGWEASQPTDSCPTLSQLSRPIPSRHHICMAHRLRMIPIRPLSNLLAMRCIRRHQLPQSVRSRSKPQPKQKTQKRVAPLGRKSPKWCNKLILYII